MFSILKEPTFYSKDKIDEINDIIKRLSRQIKIIDDLDGSYQATSGRYTSKQMFTLIETEAGLDQYVCHAGKHGMKDGYYYLNFFLVKRENCSYLEKLINHKFFW